MQRELYFCRKWFRAKKTATEVWSEEKAHAAHDAGEPFTVLVDSLERPFCFLEVTDRAVGVGFLDGFLRESLSYSFQEVEPGKLFLTMATYRDFEGDTDKVVSGTTYIFDRDGIVTIRREVFDPHKLETSTSNADVAANYSPTPEFGQYEDLIRVERNP